MLEIERELAKLGVPIKTRHNEVAPNQYEVAPIFENSNVGSDHQQLTMQVMQNVGAPLRARLPAAREAVRRRQRLGQAQQLVDGHRHRHRTCSSPGDTPPENLQFLFFCAAVIQAVNKHQALLRASIASAGQDHRLGANEAPPAIISIFLGAELEKVFDGDRVRQSAARRSRARSSASARRCCRRCRCTAATATAPARSPSPATSSSSARSARRMSPAFPNTVLNTIVAEAIDELAGKLRTALKGSAPTLEKARRERRQGRLDGEQADRLRRRRLLRGVARGGREARPGQPAHDARRAAVADRRNRRSRCSRSTSVLSERELESRYEVFARAVRR